MQTSLLHCVSSTMHERWVWCSLWLFAYAELCPEPFQVISLHHFIEWIEKNTEDSIEHHEIRLNAWCLTGLSNKEGAEKSIKKFVVAQGQRWHPWCSNWSSVCLLFENDHCAVVHELLMLCAKYWVAWENGDGRYCGFFIFFSNDESQWICHD